MSLASTDSSDGLAGMGVPGLDFILTGGLPRCRVYLLHGDPGAGKTTLGLQFLLEGCRRGEPCLYVSLSESREEVQQVARSHGWNLDKLNLLEMGLADTADNPEENTVFLPSEVELKETLAPLLQTVMKLAPRRIVIDSLSEIRLLAQSALHYRRQLMQLKQFFMGRATTVLMLDDRTGGDMQVQSLAHGVIALEQLPQGYGTERRRVRVAKLRGVDFRGGFHDYKIATGGLVVYPRLVAAEHALEAPRPVVVSGVPGLDALLGGGLDAGTSTLITGSSGTGKSTLMAHYASVAAREGIRASLYLFDEGQQTLMKRSTALGIGLEAQVKSGHVKVRQVDPAELAPDELAQSIRDDVEKHECGFIAVDSLNGYLHAMPDERFLTLQLHELLQYLGHKRVVTVMVMAQQGSLTSEPAAPIDLSYVADSIVLLRFFEGMGRVRKAISVIKKRSGAHETSIRELRIENGGVTVGDPLNEFQGVLTGVPHYMGDARKLSP